MGADERPSALAREVSEGGVAVTGSRTGLAADAPDEPAGAGDQHVLRGRRAGAGGHGGLAGSSPTAPSPVTPRTPRVRSSPRSSVRALSPPQGSTKVGQVGRWTGIHRPNQAGGSGQCLTDSVTDSVGIRALDLMPTGPGVERKRRNRHIDLYLYRSIPSLAFDASGQDEGACGAPAG